MLSTSRFVSNPGESTSCGWKPESGDGQNCDVADLLVSETSFRAFRTAEWVARSRPAPIESANLTRRRLRSSRGPPQAADLARFTQEDRLREPDKMIKTCNQCHSGNFAKQQLQQGNDMIRNGRSSQGTGYLSGCWTLQGQSAPETEKLQLCFS